MLSCFTERLESACTVTVVRPYHATNIQITSCSTVWSCHHATTSRGQTGVVSLVRKHAFPLTSLVTLSLSCAITHKYRGTAPEVTQEYSNVQEHEAVADGYR